MDNLRKDQQEFPPSIEMLATVKLEVSIFGETFDTIK